MSTFQHLCDRLEAVTDARSLFGEGEGVAEETGAEATEAVTKNVRSGGGDGNALAESVRHAPKQHRAIEMHVVIADDQDGFLEALEVMAAADLDAVPEAQHWEDQARHQGAASQPGRQPPGPGGELPDLCFSFSLFNHGAQLGHSRLWSNLGIIHVDAHIVLDRREEFDAAKRVELEVEAKSRRLDDRCFAFAD